MAVLTTKDRDALPDSAYAGPGRSYPIPDASHAVNAKARATQMYDKGKLSLVAKKLIDSKANAKLGK
jgi:hypothetical protein